MSQSTKLVSAPQRPDARPRQRGMDSPSATKALSTSSTPHFFSRSYMSRDELLVKERVHRAIPLIRSPFNLRKDDRGAEEEVKPTWLNLFVDLTFVAALTVFATTHEAVAGNEVGSFIAFVVVLWWSWMSFTLFDVKYAREDVWTQFFAWAYLAVFAFLGAYSIGFRPYVLYETPNFALLQQDPLAEHAEPSAEDLNAYSSWSGTLKAFAIGRLVLGLQYIWTIFCYGLKRRPALALLLPLLGVAVSGGIALGFSFDQAHSSMQNATRLGLLFGAIALEIVLAIIVAFLHTPVRHAHSHLLLERVGLLTLIILGEGFIALCKQMSNVVSGFGFSSIQYLYVFAAISLYFLAWALIFGGPSSTHAAMSPAKAQVFAIVHLPLHVSLLLWLEGVVVALLWYNFSVATNQIGNFASSLLSQVGTYFEGLFDGNTYPTRNFTFVVNTTDELNSLANYLELTYSSLGQFNVSLTQAVAGLNASIAPWIAANPGGNATDHLQSGIETFLALTLGQTTYTVAQQYGVSANDHINDAYNAFDAIDYNYGDTTPTLEQYADFLLTIGNAILPAALFILPTCGGWLLMTCVLNYLQRAPKDRFDVLLLAYRSLVGIVLCLLGLLDLGQQYFGPKEFGNIDALPDGSGVPSYFAAVYALLNSGWLLPMLVIILASVVLFEFGVLHLAKRAYKRDGPPMSESPVGERNDEKRGDLEASHADPEKGEGHSGSETSEVVHATEAPVP